MLSFLILFFVTINRSTASTEYTSRILGEYFTIKENPYFSIETSKSDIIYLFIKKPITYSDNLRLDIEMVRFDGVEFFVPHTPILLCDILEQETTNQYDNILNKLVPSNVFNMNGMHCPIPIGVKKLKPYIFPLNITLDNDIGCGNFMCQITIETCDKENLQNCISMISANLILYLQSKHCSNNLE